MIEASEAMFCAFVYNPYARYTTTRFVWKNECPWSRARELAMAISMGRFVVLGFKHLEAVS